MTVTGDLPSLRKLVERISTSLPKGWTADPATTTPGLPNLMTYGFRHRTPTGNKLACLYISEFEAGDGAFNLTVTNIVPVEVDRLSMAEANSSLELFVGSSVQPHIDSLNLGLRMTKHDSTLGDWIGDECFKRLAAFSGGANKSTGGAHPNDRERWQEFVICVHRGRRNLPTKMFYEYLAEEGWNEERSVELVIRFEQGLDLLERYDHVLAARTRA